MKLLNKKENYTILTYFSLKDNKNYLLYTIKDYKEVKELYLSEVIQEKDTFILNKPIKPILPILSQIIKNLLLDDSNTELLEENNFNYIDINLLDNEQIEEIGYQKISLTEEQYLKIIRNKYITYPSLKLLNISELERLGYQKNNDEAITASILVLIIYLILITIYQIILLFKHIPVKSLFEVNAPSIIMWSLVISLISMTAFNFEDRDFKDSWVFVFILILILDILFTLVLKIPFHIIKIFLQSQIFSLVFTIPYSISKKTSFKIINKYQCRNYLTFYVIYLFIFAPLILILLMVQNKIFLPLILIITNIL